MSETALINIGWAERHLRLADMGTKPKLLSNHEAEAEAEALTFWKYETEAEAEAFLKHKAEAEAEAHMLPSYYKYPFLNLITCYLLKFRQNIQANIIWKWKMLSFSSFETRNPNVKFWTLRLRSRSWSRSLCQVTKLKPKPKLWVFETTKLKPKPKLWPQMLRLREADAEAASYPCLAPSLFFLNMYSPC